MHWSDGSTLLFSSLILFVLLLLVTIIKRNYLFNGEKISVINRLKMLPGKPLMLFCYFIPWMIYFSLVHIGIAPAFYSLSKPVAYEKLLEQKKDKQAEQYLYNFREFMWNRQQANE